MIKDLEARQGKVDVIGLVENKEEPRAIEKPGFSGKVCNALLKDETGSIKLTLWNEQCDQVGNGDKIHITNGYVSEWQGEKQLSTGRFGSLEVVEKGEGTSSQSPEAPKESSEETKEPQEESSVKEEEIV